MNKSVLMCGMVAVLMMVGFGSAISNVDYKEFLDRELNRYFDDKDTLLSIDELRVAINYYFDFSGDSVDLTKSELSESAQFIIDSYDVGATASVASTVSTVIAMDHKACADGDVYWFDSNDEKGAKMEECGSVDEYSLKDACYDYDGSGYCGTCKYNEKVECWDHNNDVPIVGCTSVVANRWFGGEYGFVESIVGDVRIYETGNPIFSDAKTEYLLETGYVVWRGESKGGAAYNVCMTDKVVQ